METDVTTNFTLLSNSIRRMGNIRNIGVLWWRTPCWALEMCLAVKVMYRKRVVRVCPLYCDLSSSLFAFKFLFYFSAARRHTNISLRSAHFFFLAGHGVLYILFSLSPLLFYIKREREWIANIQPFVQLILPTSYSFSCSFHGSQGCKHVCACTSSFFLGRGGKDFFSSTRSSHRVDWKASIDPSVAHTKKKHFLLLLLLLCVRLELLVAWRRLELNGFCQVARLEFYFSVAARRLPDGNFVYVLLLPLANK